MQLLTAKSVARTRPRVGYHVSVPPSEPSPERPQITQILRRLEAGEAGAADDLLPLVYDELRQLAKSRMARLAAGQTLQATALVHEAWVKLGGRDAVRWDDRAHFFGAAARAMRLILVDQARRKGRDKRGGDVAHEELHADLATPGAAGDDGLDLEALDRALDRLEQKHPRQAQLVMLRFFGGLGMKDIAEQLSVSLATAERDWLFARSWLHREMAAR